MSKQNPDLPWMVESARLVGVREIGSTNISPTIDEWLKELKVTYVRGQAWCAVFTAICLHRAGFKRAKTASLTSPGEYPYHLYRAGDYRVGAKRLKKPAYGCIAVKPRDGGNHVGFVVGRAKNGKIVIRGGNQSNMVCDALYNESLFEYYWFGKTNTPAAIRWDLPLAVANSSKVSES